MPAKNTIVISEYSNEWKIQFDLLKQVYLNHLDHLAISVEHVGSTAVPGLCAKPVLDIDIVIKAAELTQVATCLSRLGYEFMGEVGIPDRFVFRQYNHSIPNDGSDRLWPKHHLYCCIDGSVALRNHIILRDALRASPEQSIAYGKLKKKLASEVAGMDEYVMRKTVFISSILAKKGMNKDELAAIAEQNKSVIR